MYVAGYTAGRFVIEQMRTDYATRVFGDIRINVVVAAVVCVGALVYLAVVRKPREVLEGPAADGSRARGRARGGEAEPAVVLTKSDKREEPDEG